MDGGRRRRKPQREGRAVADELGRGPREPVGKIVQRIQERGLIAPVLQDAGLVFQELVEVREDLGIAGPDLADGVIHETPPNRRPLLDEV